MLTRLVASVTVIDDLDVNHSVRRAVLDAAKGGQLTRNWDGAR